MTDAQIEQLRTRNVELSRVVEELSTSRSTAEALQKLEAERSMLLKYVENDIPQRMQALEAERDAHARAAEAWRGKHRALEGASRVRSQSVFVIVLLTNFGGRL